MGIDNKSKYVVLDVETTGLFPKGPKGNDRIIEISILLLDDDGKSIHEYATLINPLRDVGPTHIHGIKASDVIQAPTFDRIAGDILEFIADSVVIGHNITFDLRFLFSEFNLLGVTIPKNPYLCTLSLSSRILPATPNRKLITLCQFCGIKHNVAHCALDDSHAVTSLLQIFLNKMGASSLASFQSFIINPPSAIGKWPTLPKTGITLTRNSAAETLPPEKTYIHQLILRLPSIGNMQENLIDYEISLDRALEDRQITIDECNQLEELARNLNLSKDDACIIHRRYLLNLIYAALEDGIITEPEKEDIKKVCQLLALTEEDYNKTYKEAQTAIVESKPIGLQRFQNDPKGKTVCFTGELLNRIEGERATREIAERKAAEAGMIVKNSVTKKLDILVVSDPNTLSGKAKKAHEYGVRVIAEPVFWRMIGVSVE